jgi:small subunit ribosomal protein S6
MEIYESLFIIRPSVSDEETNALIEKMKGVADKTGAQFIKSENWGRKKLAYEVRRERKGTYAYFYFRAPNNTVGELERAYRLEDNIIKFLTIHLEKELVPRRPLEAAAQESDGGRI